MSRIKLLLLSILIICSHGIMGQTKYGKITPVKSLVSNHSIRDIPIHVTIDYSMENDRHYILIQNNSVSDISKKEWYVYDIEKTALLKIDANEDCVYLGFSSDSLYSYLKSTRNLFYCKYPSMERIPLQSNNTARANAMRFVAEQYFANGISEYSINRRGDLAYYNSIQNALTLILFSNEDTIPIEIPATEGCSHLQWIDTTRLFFSELMVLDALGSLTFTPKCYDLSNNTIASIPNTSDDISDIYDYYQGELVLRDGDKLKLLGLKDNQVKEYPLPKDFPWIYCVYYIGENRFLISAEYHEKDCFPFFILSYD